MDAGALPGTYVVGPVCLGLVYLGLLYANYAADTCVPRAVTELGSCLWDVTEGIRRVYRGFSWNTSSSALGKSEGDSNPTDERFLDSPHDEAKPLLGGGGPEVWRSQGTLSSASSPPKEENTDQSARAKEDPSESWGPIQTGMQEWQLKNDSSQLRALHLHLLEGGMEMTSPKMMDLQLRFFASPGKRPPASRAATFSPAEIAGKFEELVCAANVEIRSRGGGDSKPDSGSKPGAIPSGVSAPAISTSAVREDAADRSRELAARSHAALDGARDSWGPLGENSPRRGLLAQGARASSLSESGPGPSLGAAAASLGVARSEGGAGGAGGGGDAADAADATDATDATPAGAQDNNKIDVDALLQDVVAGARADQRRVALKPVRPVASPEKKPWARIPVPEYGYGFGPVDLELWAGTGVVWRVSVILDVERRRVMGLVNHDANDAFLNIDSGDDDKTVDDFFGDFDVSERCPVPRAIAERSPSARALATTCKGLQLTLLEYGAMHNAALVAVVLAELRRRAEAGDARIGDAKKGHRSSGDADGLTCGQAVVVVLFILLLAACVMGGVAVLVSRRGSATRNARRDARSARAEMLEESENGGGGRAFEARGSRCATAQSAEPMRRFAAPQISDPQRLRAESEAENVASTASNERSPTHEPTFEHARFPGSEEGVRVAQRLGTLHELRGTGFRGPTRSQAVSEISSTNYSFFTATSLGLHSHGANSAYSTNSASSGPGSYSASSTSLSSTGSQGWGSLSTAASSDVTTASTDF